MRTSWNWLQNARANIAIPTTTEPHSRRVRKSSRSSFHPGTGPQGTSTGSNNRMGIKITNTPTATVRIWAVSEVWRIPYSGHTNRISAAAEKTRSHLTNTSIGLRSSRVEASQESFPHIVRNEPRACGSFAAKQTVSQFSNVDDIVACAVGLALCFFDFCGGERSVRFRSAGVLYPICRNRMRYHQSDSGELQGSPSVLRWGTLISLREE